MEGWGWVGVWEEEQGLPHQKGDRESCWRRSRRMKLGRGRWWGAWRAVGEGGGGEGVKVQAIKACPLK